MTEDPLIIALDVASAEQARRLVERLGAKASFYKVGMELYAAAGMDFVRELVGARKQVFLDLKFYDIGETVKRAVAQVAKCGVRFLTIHAVKPVMQAAVEGRGSSQLELLGVTVLTSLDDGDLAELGYRYTVSELVALRVRHARETGVNGVVCSPVEVARVREMAGPDMVLVTPGVRSAGAAAGDQKRIATPGDAMRNGADYLVIGRQVTRATDPAAELERIRAEVTAARSHA